MRTLRVAGARRGPRRHLRSRRAHPRPELGPFSFVQRSPTDRGRLAGLRCPPRTCLVGRPSPRQGGTGVNLKEAAARLGVHYQTAYRWVRSGDLTAVRVGARYEVSDAAIHQFIATRHSVLRQAVPAGGVPRCRGRRRPRRRAQDLEAMAGEPLISLPALTAFAARARAARPWPTCASSRSPGADGRIERAALDHPHPERAAFIAAALSITGADRPGPDGILAPVLDRGRGHPHPTRTSGPSPRRASPRAAPVPRRVPDPGAARGADHRRRRQCVGMVAFVRDDSRTARTRRRTRTSRPVSPIGSARSSSPPERSPRPGPSAERVADRFQRWIAGVAPRRAHRCRDRAGAAAGAGSRRTCRRVRPGRMPPRRQRGHRRHRRPRAGIPDRTQPSRSSSTRSTPRANGRTSTGSRRASSTTTTSASTGASPTARS